MKLRFLCGAHRIEISQKPAAAINCWQNGFDTGQFLCDQSQWQEAVPHLGCAFETSEIILTTNAVEPACAYKLLTSSALLLIDALEKLDCIEQCLEVYWMASNRLTQELACQAEARLCITRHLKQLYNRVQHSSFKVHQSGSRASSVRHLNHTAVH